MKQIFAPWRIEYIKAKKSRKCIFCEKPKQKDDKALIVFRGKQNFIILNSYPYNNGHVMIAPYKHKTNLEDLDQKERTEHYDLLIKSIKVLKKCYKAQGFNLGINLGKAAGAGLEHVHTHVVPRWLGDTNFMPVISDTKIIPESLKAAYKKLGMAFKKF